MNKVPQLNEEDSWYHNQDHIELAHGSCKQVKQMQFKAKQTQQQTSMGLSS